ncbi:MAG: nucleoside kinase, partial [Paludibacteraceae bacterium]|nr:nucleoside kinase [Paludibacteraceae bacterium]
MNKTITIYCKNTRSYHDFPVGVSLLDIYKELDIKLPYPVVCARVNYKSQGLNYLVYNPKDIDFIDESKPAGMRCYIRTLTMVLAKAVNSLYPQSDVRIDHPVCNGYQCSLTNLDGPVTPDMVRQIKQQMDKIVAADEPIQVVEKHSKLVKQLFADRDDSKDALIDAMSEPYFRFYQMGDYIDYYDGVLMPSTGYLDVYDLIPYNGGVLMQVPDQYVPKQLAGFVEQLKICEVFKDFVDWSRLVHVGNVGELNKACRSGRTADLIKVSEAIQEKKIIQIADTICGKEHRPRFVLVSGPSSSGKTTFSKRLQVHLMVNGLDPLIISMDNYFVNRVDSPRDENGDYDFEDIRALDLGLLQQQVNDLLNGKEVELPSYSFEKGEREYRGNKLQLKPNSIIIMEGIHALNPQTLPDIPRHEAFRIYVSALTTISLDNHNWIPTTDTRLLRRIVRDYRYRHYSAHETIQRAPSVRRGEEKWIFPYQENADVMFNSALLFELAV